MKRILTAVALLGALLLPGVASAEPGFLPRPVKMRAGPGVNYPPIITLPGNSGVEIIGCLSDMSWCDVSWGAYRGWVAGSYLRMPWEGQYRPLYAAPPPVIVFDFGSYWERYYSGLPFYGRRDRWQPHPVDRPRAQEPRPQPQPQPQHRAAPERAREQPQPQHQPQPQNHGGNNGPDNRQGGPGGNNGGGNNGGGNNGGDRGGCQPGAPCR